MTKKDTFVYLGYGTAYNCQFATGRYGNGNLALEIMGAEGTEYEGEPIVRVTVNPGCAVADGHIAIKDYSENEGMVEFCKKIGIIEGNPTQVIPSGYVEITVYKLTDSGKELFSTEN